jgi:hypothetical protein
MLLVGPLLRVATVDGKNLAGQRGGGRSVAFVDGPHRAVQQFIDRCTALAGGSPAPPAQDWLRVPVSRADFSAQ